MGREHNPYTRHEERNFGAPGYLTAGLGRAPRRSDTEEGPGLTAGDLDAIARHHFQDGHAAGQRAMEPRLDQALNGQAKAWDDGFVAGVKDRRAGLAQDFYARLIAVRLAIVEAQQVPKSRAHAQLDVIAEELAPVLDFALALMGREKSLEEAVDPT